MSNSVLKEKSLLGNCIILAPDGQVLCRTAQNRLDWYLKRNLAENIPNQKFPTIRLKFNPSGRKGSEDSYNIEDKENICVVCGTSKNLTKHHIIPYVYRKEFPVELKGHAAYDVVLLCREHHNEYEILADKQKKQLLESYGFPCAKDKKVSKIEAVAKKSAYSLKNHSNFIPADRIKFLRKNIELFLNKEVCNDEDIEKLALKKESVSYNQSYGKEIVSRLIENNELQKFVKMWRVHFVENCKPQFLSKKWNVNKEI